MVTNEDIINIIGKKALRDAITEFSEIEKMDFDFLQTIFSNKELLKIIRERKEEKKHEALENIKGSFFSLARERLKYYLTLEEYEKWINEDLIKNSKKKAKGSYNPEGKE